jgi:hypothetical protein
MQCFVCGEPMRVVMVEPHHVIDMPGFELRTFQCVGCGDVEKRPFFDSERSRRAPAPAPALVPEPAPESSEPIAPRGSRKKSIFGGLVRLRGAKQ